MNAESETEAARLADELAEEGFLAEDLVEIRRSWETAGKAGMVELPNVDQEWERFREMSGFEEAGMAQEGEAPETKTPSMRMIPWAVAAGIALCIVIGIWQFGGGRGKMELVEAGKNGRNVELADGSDISLGKGAVLQYAENFETDRELEFVGEAYFEVEKDPEHPFAVEMEGVRIKVLGTAFHLRNVEGEPSIEVNLMEGRLAVEAASETLIGAGERLLINRKSGEILERTELRRNALAWKEKALHFSDTPFPEFKDDTEKYFGIELLGSLPASCLVNGDFTEPEPEGLLEVVGVGMGIRFEQVEEGKWRLIGNSCEQ